MGGKSGGGGVDADAMLKYGQKGLDLQKQIYDTNRADAQPWYQTGTAAVGQLSKLLGLNGTSANTNPSTRQGLIDQYKGQFTSTTQPTNAGQKTYYDKKTGKIATNNSFIESMNPMWRDMNYSVLNTQPSSTSTTDTAGLNKYVDDLLAKQGTANESDPAFGSLAKSFGMEDFQTDPGYQFRLDEGQKALERKLNASGKTFSPEAAKALLEYNQNMGSQEYNNSYNRFNINQDNLFNRLSTLSGFGQTASGQIANAGTNYANAGTEQYNGMGNAVTSANLANKANNSSMFNTLLGAGAQLGGAYLMSDERLKENIKQVGFEKGLPIYEFNYINIPETRFRGVLAQDVIKINPEAIREFEGYMGVNYAMLGLEMQEV